MQATHLDYYADGTKILTKSTRLKFAKHSCAISALTLLAVGADAQKKGVQPNIIFFLMDDMGYADISLLGQQYIETPNIDALAKSGKILTQHYAGAPVSAPSRCALLTGQNTGHAPIRGNDEWGERGNVWDFGAMTADANLEGQRPMPKNTITVAKLLQQAGYTTACIGKWGLGAPNSEGAPNKIGFDFFYGYNCQRLAHSYYPTHLYKDSVRQYLDNKPMQPSLARLDSTDNPLDARCYDKFRQKQYAPDLMFERTINFIDENKKRPFFLWWTTPMPHVSLQAPQDLIDYYVAKFGDEKPFLGGSYYPARYPRATYAAMVSHIDRQIGAIIEKLKTEGIYENTVIIFTSDNGPTTEGGNDAVWFDSSYPFKSEKGWSKGSMHEGGLRVPTIVSWPKHIKPKSYSTKISAFWDWMPTLLDIASAKKLTPKNCDGISILPTLTGRGAQDTHHYLYWELSEGGGQAAVRQGDWKLIITNIKKEPIYALYNLAEDPREQNNLATHFVDIVAHLKALANRMHTEPQNPAFVLPFPLK